MISVNPPEQEINRFLPRTDSLTEEDFELTMEAYKANPNLYADAVEWLDESVYAVWDGFFHDLKDFILQLPENSQALVVGCGTLRDTLMLLLLNKEVSATAIDLSEEMIEVGRSKINIENILKLARLISETDDYENGWIGEILGAFDKLKTNLPEFSKNSGFEEYVLNDINKRLTLLVEDARYLSPAILDNLDFIIGSAVIQHFPDADIFPTIRNLILGLKPGGTLLYNLRMDVLKGERGRVFEDTILNGMPRRYNTFTNEGVGKLVREIYDDEELRVENVTIKQARSIEEGKPDFKSFVVTRQEF